MGIVKRMMEEAEARGYSSNEDKSVCSDCFEEYGIKEFIESNISASVCSYCGGSSRKTKACELDVVIEFILECVSYEWGHPADEGLPYETREGGWQVSSVYNTWELLNNLGIDVQDDLILEDISYSIHNEEWCERDPYSLRTDQTLMYGWNDFSEFVINTSRYVFLKAKNNNYDEDQHDEMNPVDILDALGSIVQKLNLVKELPENTEIKRVRIVDLDKELSSAKELGTPPREFSTIANRMSPAGIPMFYGAFDINTAIKETYESKPGETKKAICGSFHLTKSIKVIDLSRMLYIPSLFDQEERQNRSDHKFLLGFVSDFTKPIDRADRAHIDYVPTQIVTEYFRHVLLLENKDKIDGVIYPSSKNPKHKAIVLFATSNQCVEVDKNINDDALLVLESSQSIEL